MQKSNSCALKYAVYCMAMVMVMGGSTGGGEGVHTTDGGEGVCTLLMVVKVCTLLMVVKVCAHY